MLSYMYHFLPYSVLNWYTISNENVDPTNITKCQKDFQRQVGEMVEKLASWREDSHKQMSTIISSHCKTFDISFNDLVEEFSELQSSIRLEEREDCFAGHHQ